MIDKTEFGIFLKAFRNGFRYSLAHEIFLRLKWLNKYDSIFQVEVCPTEEIAHIKSRRCESQEKYIDWDHAGGQALIGRLNLPSHDSYQVFIYNKSGELIK